MKFTMKSFPQGYMYFIAKRKYIMDVEVNYVFIEKYNATNKYCEARIKHSSKINALKFAFYCQ